VEAHPSERSAAVASEEIVGSPVTADAQAASTGAVASGSRAAGIVFTLGYLLGLVPGPVVAAVGGLALITFGRSLLLERRAATLAAGALAVVAAALGVGALRWGTLDLVELRGVQAVLGPTLWVGPQQVALASGIAAGGALLALGVWSALGPRLDRGDRVWLSLEGLVAVLAVVTVFLDPVRLLGDRSPSGFVELSSWAGAALVAGLLVLGMGRLLAGGGRLLRVLTVALSAAATVGAAVVMVVSL
jgi:hypothetical protein